MVVGMVVRMLVVDGVKYRPWTPEKESEFEHTVKDHAKDIFGEDSIYFDLKQKLTSKGGVGSILDGYVITLSEKPHGTLLKLKCRLISSMTTLFPN